MERFVYYFFSTVIIGFIYYLGMEYQVVLKEESSATFNLFPYLTFTTIFPIFFGMLVRVPKLIIEIKENKQWTFDWVKVVAIGIPLLYITVIPLMSLSTGIDMLFTKEVLLIGDTSLTTTTGIILGYILLDSVKK
ncbi:hypothetical protein WAK64_13440 [Bacillus spongiae]|uniref:Uncharacterized protein n=1 Tax=Bacillus spongiae TaxID=2683610 RepID=A0ABU8HF99_9BACI